MLVQEQLRLDEKGIALLYTRLRDATGAGPDLDVRFDRLMCVLRTILGRLGDEFGDQIERVLAVGEWAVDGVDLCILPYDDITLLIVLRSTERPFDMYWRIAEKAFDGLRDENVFVQFDLDTLPEWQRAVSLARANGREGALGVPL